MTFVLTYRGIPHGEFPNDLCVLFESMKWDLQESSDSGSHAGLVNFGWLHHVAKLLLHPVKEWAETNMKNTINFGLKSALFCTDFIEKINFTASIFSKNVINILNTCTSILIFAILTSYA